MKASFIEFLEAFSRLCELTTEGYPDDAIFKNYTKSDMALDEKLDNFLFEIKPHFIVIREGQAEHL